MISIKTDKYLVYVKVFVWPTISYVSDKIKRFFFEVVKDSKYLLMGCWRIERNCSNHPSIAHRGVSCSKVGVGESVPSLNNFWGGFIILFLLFFFWVVSLSLKR